MAQTTTGNVLSSGALDKAVNKIAVETYASTARFAQLGSKAGKPMGANSYSFYVVDDIAATVAGTTLTEGTTTTPTTFTMNEVNVTLTQRGIFVELSDVVLEDSPVEASSAAARELGEKIAKVEDQFIQGEISGGTNAIYSGDATSTATIDVTDTLDATDLAIASAKLRNDSATTFDGDYVAVAHPFALHDLRLDTSANGFLEANKYVTPEKIFNGEVGKMNGVRVIESPYVVTNTDAGAGTVDTYNTFVFAQNAFGVVNNVDNGVRTYVRMPQAQDGDELAQRGSVGVKLRCGAAILKQAGIQRIESASSLGDND